MIIKFYSDGELQEVWEVADTRVTSRRLSMVFANLQFLMNDEDGADTDAFIEIGDNTVLRISELLYDGTVTRVFIIPNECAKAIRRYQFGGATK